MKKYEFKYNGSQTGFVIYFLIILVLTTVTFGLLSPVLIWYPIRHFIKHTKIIEKDIEKDDKEEQDE